MYYGLSIREVKVSGEKSIGRCVGVRFLAYETMQHLDIQYWMWDC